MFHANLRFHVNRYIFSNIFWGFELLSQYSQWTLVPESQTSKTFLKPRKCLKAYVSHLDALYSILKISNLEMFHEIAVAKK